MRQVFRKLNLQVQQLKRRITPIYYALIDARTPILPKILAALTVAYLLSPIDLIPDFIPVLGFVDDLLIEPTLIVATLRLLPKNILRDSIRKTNQTHTQLARKWYFAIPVILMYTGMVIFCFPYIKHLFSK